MVAETRNFLIVNKAADDATLFWSIEYWQPASRNEFTSLQIFTENILIIEKALYIYEDINQKCTALVVSEVLAGNVTPEKTNRIQIIPSLTCSKPAERLCYRYRQAVVMNSKHELPCPSWLFWSRMQIRESDWLLKYARSIASNFTS